MKPALPLVPGPDAGVVQAVGEGYTERLARGRPARHRWLWQPHLAGCAVHAAASGVSVCRCAAAFIMIYATSWHALMDRAAQTW
jgi:NADPH2:quinone reductase